MRTGKTMKDKFSPGDRVRSKKNGRTGRIIYSAFSDGKEYPVVWDDLKSCKYVPEEELEKI